MCMLPEIRSDSKYYYNMLTEILRRYIPCRFSNSSARIKRVLLCSLCAFILHGKGDGNERRKGARKVKKEQIYYQRREL